MLETIVNYTVTSFIVAVTFIGSLFSSNEDPLGICVDPWSTNTPPQLSYGTVTEGEKFLMDLLPVLYSGDKVAIRKSLYIEGLDDDFINMIIDDMNYCKTAEKHSGYASAKVNRCESDTLDGKELYRFDTTVTFKDWTMREEVFKIVKDSPGTFKLYE